MITFGCPIGGPASLRAANVTSVAHTGPQGRGPSTELHP
jgi:hypothetical protein